MGQREEIEICEKYTKKDYIKYDEEMYIIYVNERKKY